MATSSARHYLESDDVGDVTVVRFTLRSIRADEVIQTVFDSLDQLAASGRTRLVLDFGSVQDFASLTIGKLIALDKRLRPPAGRLALCELTPVVTELLAIMGLERHFHVYRTQEEALRSF